MKKVLKITAIVLGSLSLLLAGFGLYFKMQIKPVLISQLNKQLTVKVEVEHIAFSGLSGFPNLGIRFRNVSVQESQKHYNKALLQAQDLYLYVDVIKLWNKEYVVDEVVIRNGWLNLADLQTGSNYDIFKSDSSTESMLSFAIKKLKFQNVEVAYEHLPSDFISSGTFQDMLAKLEYTDARTTLDIAGDLYVKLIQQDRENYLRDKQTSLSTSLVLEEQYSHISIAPSDLNIAGVDLSTRGTVVVGDAVDMDISFENDEADLNSILSIIPESLQESFNHLSLAGSAKISGYFKGRVSNVEDPSFGFNYNIKNATVFVREQNLRLKNIGASGEMSIPNMGNMNSSWMTCRIDNASSGRTRISGKLKLENFNMPRINWDGLISMDAGTAIAILDYKDLDVRKGSVLIDGACSFTLNPNTGEVQQNSLYYVGKLKASGLQGSLKDPALKIHDFNLDLSADNKQMVIKSCNMDYNQTKATLIGYILNANDLLSSNSGSEIVGELKLQNLNINELYTENGDTATGKTGDLFPYSLKLRTELSHFRYNNFIATSISGTLVSDKRSFSMTDCKIAALDGESVASVRFSGMGQNYLLDVNSRLNAINIKELFRQFDNFEQDEITDRNISGRLTGKILAKVILDRHYEPVMDKLYAKADVEIVNGQLVDYEPLNELSAFVEVEDLQNVRFDMLKNSIEIFDQTIYIPQMHIGNNALSLQLEGTHTFENYMDYRISISLMEILANKSNWMARKQEKRIEENQTGGLTAYLTMKGTPEDLKITYDRATQREAIADEIKKEKRNFINALRGESTEPENQKLTNYNDIWDE